MKQNNVFSDESGHGTKLNALATEFTPKMKINTSTGEHSNIDDDWIKTKKSIPITRFLKSAKIKKRTQT